VPAIDDNGFYLSESRAIMQYLANAYGKNDSVYPKHPKEKALVDHRLYFDLHFLQHEFGENYVIHNAFTILTCLIAPGEDFSIVK